MNIQFIFTDGILNILRVVKNLSNIFAQLLLIELKNENFIKRTKYYNTVTFKEALNESWTIEWNFIDDDPENIVRMKIYWNIGKDDPNAETLYPEGNNAQKFIAEYIVSYQEEQNSK